MISGYQNDLNRFPIEKLLLMAVRKQVPIDRLLDSKYTAGDYDRLSYWLARSNIERYGYEKCWDSYSERNDMLYLSKLLYSAKSNQTMVDIVNADLFKDEERADLSMEWDDFDESSSYAENVYDGLIMSLSDRGRVDITYIASLTGLNTENVIASLKGLIYQDPERWQGDHLKGWECADEYLSGNMYRKLLASEKAEQKFPGRFTENIDAILNIYPKIADFEDIYVALGTPWIPTDVIDDFIEHLLGVSSQVDRKRNITRYDPLSGSWEIRNGDRYRETNLSMCRIWGTKRCDALKILSDCLNMKKSVVNDSVWGTKSSGEHGWIYEVNKEETALAQEKQKQQNEEFRRWVWSDEQRKKRLLDIYEEKYGSFVKRRYDGSFLKFPGLSPDVKLYDYQKDAVARILFSKNTLLAHDVGSGKTYEMIAAGMEMIRLRKSKKNLYVVPNNITGQWKSIFYQMYPQADVMVVEPRTFPKDRRQEVLAKIRDEEHDAIIMAYSCFDMIPMSRRSSLWNLKKKRADITQLKATVTGNTSSLDRKEGKILAKIRQLKKDEMQEEEGICFDDLKINALFVDEAHNYKNISLNTKMNSVLGIHTKGSRKCDLMAEKIAYVQRSNNGGGVVLATGTPLTNSISEAFVLQKFLQPGELNLLDLESFDSWAGMFTEMSIDHEIDVAGSSYRLASRISRYHNLKELTMLFSSIADFHKVSKENGIPDFEGYTDVVVKKSAEVQEILDEISKRADRVRKHFVTRKEDNMLQITTDGRKAALDLRLLDAEKYKYSSENKVSCCAKNVYREYCLGRSDQGTQLVFCDTSTPKDGFNLYDELTRLLVSAGVPRKEIAYIHDATDDRQRNDLYSKVRKGEIRILIGSTAKLGLGVNVQERVRAIHHLDIPWRPADMIQREGRGLRKGNLNKSIKIYRYIMEGSFDAYLYQLLEMKQRFIDQLIGGSLDQRDLGEISETVLSYAEVKALAVGNPLIKERVEILNEITRLKMIRDQNILTVKGMEKELLEMPARIRIMEDLVEKAEKDLLLIPKDSDGKKEDSEQRQKYREMIEEGLKTNVMMPAERFLMTYRGFDIYLPKQMSAAEPYLVIAKNGRYQVILGDSFQGNLVRLDRFFDSFENRILMKYRKELEELLKNETGLKEEISKKDGVPEKIEKLLSDLKRINERMELNYEG